MKILFAPSETKTAGGESPSITGTKFALYHDSKEVVMRKYQAYLKNASTEEIQKLFGIKNEKDIAFYKAVDLYHDKTMPAILRYTGVAYDYLDYPTLDVKAQNFLHDSLIIFSNVLGALKCGEAIPNYKSKQSERLGDFTIEKFYKEHTSDILDSYFEDSLIVDLRASFYDKFYIPNKPYITMKFIKEGKVVSHWAKAYRGKVVRTLAKHQPKTEQDLADIVFENLRIKEIVQKGNKKEYVFDIVG